ncbi:MAG: ABC transporter ATP-binding protein [Lachnospiraceae bacterium]|nr:ABC transporter ATP-binding protein [Lachnospiraceae bacterium]
MTKNMSGRYFGRCIQDIMRFMPLLFWGKLFTSIAEGILKVWHPLLIAEIFQLAPELNDVNIRIFKRKIIFLCICIGFPSVCTLLLRAVGLYGECRKETFYGSKMYEFARKMRLEALEDKTVLDGFRKADAAYSQHLAGSRMLSYLLIDVEAALLCISTFFVVGSFSVWLLPGAVLGVVPHLLIEYISERRRNKVYRGQSAKRRRLAYLWRLFCTKEPVKEMRTMGFQEFLKKKWVRTNVDVVQEMEELELKAVRLSALGVLVRNCCYVANVAIALVLMLQGELAAGQFAACLMAFGLLQDQLFMLSSFVTAFLQSYHHVEEYYDFFQAETEDEGGEPCHSMEENHARPAKGETGIKLRNVHFRYPGAEQDTLNGVDLDIRKGEHIVIVGVNGSGKTTLSKVLTGAYRAASGEIRYDGQNISKIRKKELYRDISLVSQDFVHYNFSFRENICISDFEHMRDEGRIRKVTDVVGMQELIQSIGGLDVQLGREFGGCELSGGEWQKVAIARGLFRDSELIVLDEPTSALDPLVEYEVLTGFLNLIQGRTSVVISHRVGICRHADKVVVMKEGKVVECGSHEELKSAGGEYARIWGEQAKWY